MNLQSVAGTAHTNEFITTTEAAQQDRVIRDRDQVATRLGDAQGERRRRKAFMRLLAALGPQIPLNHVAAVMQNVDRL